MRVTITSPAEVSSGPADLTVSGKATLPAWHSVRLRVSTQGDSHQIQPTAKGAWAVQVTDLILGETTICAEIYDGGGGYVTAGCVRYTVLPTPDRFTIDTLPVTLTGTEEAGSVVQVFHSDQMQCTDTVTSSAGTWSIVLDRDYFDYEGVLTGRRATVGFTVWALDEVGSSSPTTTLTYTTRLR